MNNEIFTDYECSCASDQRKYIPLSVSSAWLGKESLYSVVHKILSKTSVDILEQKFKKKNCFFSILKDKFLEAIIPIYFDNSA